MKYATAAAFGEKRSQPVSVEVAKPTPGIDAELVEGGKITGAITLVGGGALSGGIQACASPTGANNAYEAHELKKCAQAHETAGSASATSNALAIPTSGPKSEGRGPSRERFKLVKKRFDAKTGKLDLLFEILSAGTRKWKLTFTSTRGRKAGKAPAARSAKGGKGAHCSRAAAGGAMRCRQVSGLFGKGSQARLSRRRRDQGEGEREGGEGAAFWRGSTCQRQDQARARRRRL